MLTLSCAPRRTFTAVAALFSITTSFYAQAATAATAQNYSRNWPTWRGPLATGVSPSANPPIHWAEDKNIKWKVAIPGRGTASPVVWEDQIFILTAIPSEPESGKRPGGGGPGGVMVEGPRGPQKFTLLSLERATGKVRWQKTSRTQVPHEGHHKDHGFASGSPVTDGEIVIAYFGSYGIYAYDLTGKLLWEKDLGDMQTRNGFGEGSSPALDGDTVVVLWDHEGEDFIVALDKRTGKELWRQTRDEPTGWCTPFIVSHAGRKQAVVNGTKKARGYDLATGELLWECGGQTANAIPSAVADTERIYVMSGFRGAACQAIALGSKGDLTGGSAIAWSLSKGTPYVPSPLLSNGRLYYHAGNNPQLSICDAKTGKVELDTERLATLTGVYASPVAAAGRVYLVGRNGAAVVMREGPVLDILATNKLDEGIDASPALAGSELFLRGQESLYCITEAR